MDIFKVFDDPQVKMLEKSIKELTQISGYKDKEPRSIMKFLLDERASVLYKLNVYDDDMKRLLNEFNDALRKACAELHRRVIDTYKEYSGRNDYSGDFEVEGKLFLGFEYPKAHPIQTETAIQVWDALTQGEFLSLYDEGCAWPLRCSKEYPPEHSGVETLEKWIGMEDKNDNWNEGLDKEWSKDMHLIQPFHNLYDHMKFSLYDLIYVREFNLEVNIQLDDNISFD